MATPAPSPTPLLKPLQRDGLKQQLLQNKNELEQLLGGQQDKAQPVILDQQAVGRVSRIDAIQQQEMAKAGQQHTEQHLLDINAALQRLESDDYGFCEECGQMIAVARLTIKPEAEFCIGCQSSHD
ncbi:MAG: DnaK suppressor protein [Phenylobacterium sp.]|jgi:DnaK suppressor protein